EKALAPGNWKYSDVEKWYDKRLAEIIFESGISTSDTADLNAGRGVGMDIIQSRVQSVGGQIVIDSQPGQFTEFVISLPLEDPAVN
ncbi:MAG: ATP-binding protein, partial [Bacteroidales bacterium]|nr:ATP-binding protein [Bacteroidales bacterium]